MTLVQDMAAFVAGARPEEGFHSRPAKRETILEKFRRLAVPFAGEDLSTAIANAVDSIEGGPITELTALLGRIEAPGTVRRERRI